MLETIALEINCEERNKVKGDNFQATSIAEINNYKRLCLLCHVYKSNMESIEKVFSKEHLRPSFGEV